MSLVGTSVRSIRLVEQLGQGGMGEVYVGVDERLDRKVAVKVIRAERRLDEAARARFLREARILSQLEHPNICRLYDYVEQDGCDFLILELVHGKSLREVIAARPDPATALAFAVQVVQALAAAHALSVAHRDLKPENIVVGDDGIVKVLDFGLARPVVADTGQRPPERTEVTTAPPHLDGSSTVTELGILLGTPRYMSPEQARGEGATAASDMYAFGLVLQELLTGTPPFPPELPAAVLLQRAMWGETAPVAGISPALATLVGRLKSLSPKDRPDAAATLERLRWIADAPRRRFRRLALGAVAAALALAAVVSTVGYVRIGRALARAEASERAARQSQSVAEAINAFLTRMLASADPRRMGIDVKVADVLDQAVTTADAELIGDALTHAAVLDTLGATYHALGDLQKAHPLLDRALATRSSELGPEAAETLTTKHRLGALLSDEAAFAAAEATLTEVVDARGRVLGELHPDTLESVAMLGVALQRARKFEEAEVRFRQALDGRRGTLGEAHPATLQSMRLLGSIHVDFRRWSEAEPLLRECLAKSRAQLGPAHPDTLAAVRSLGVFYSRQKKEAEAEALFRENVEQCVKVLGEDHPVTINAARNLAGKLAALKRFDDAEALLAEAYEASVRVLGPAHYETLEVMRTQGAVAFDRGDIVRAERIYRDRWIAARRYLGDEHRVTLETWSVVAVIAWQTGDLDQAEATYRKILAIRARTLGPDHDATRNSKRYLVKLLRDRGRSREADALEATLPPGSREPPVVTRVDRGPTR